MIGSTNELSPILTSITSPSLAGGSDFFVNTQLDSTPSLLLGYYDMRSDPAANTGIVQSPAIAVASSAKVAASGDYVGVTYVASGTVYFVLLRRDGNTTSAFSQVTSKSIGSGASSWIALHPNGWIVLYVNGGIRLASFEITTGLDMKTTSVDSGASMPSLGTSTGTSFVFSYNKAGLANALQAVVASMASDGTFTTLSTNNLGIGNTLYAVPSYATIAPNGKALVSYLKSNNNYAYVTITAGTASGETVLQASTTTSAAVLSLSSGYFVALWEVSSAIKGILIPADGSPSTSFNVATGAKSPALASLGPYRLIIGWATTASTAKSATRHFAIQHCGDGFVTSNEICDSGAYCLSDCTCPTDQSPVGTGCTAPGVPFVFVPVSPPVSVPMDAPADQTPVIDTPSAAPVSEPATSTPGVSNEPTFVPSSIPSSDVVQTPTDPLDEVVGGTLTLRFLIVILAVGVAVALGVTLLIVLLQRRKRTKHKAGSGGDGPPPTTYDQIYVNSYTLNSEPMDLSRFTIDERLHIPYSELKFLQEIGSGAFGKVFIGEWQKTKVALKINMMAQGTEFEKEARLMVAMRPHPNVVQLYGISTDGPNPVMIIEFCEGGSLDTKLYKARVNLSLKSQLQLISGIAKGLLHLHTNKIVHRDLAARNILLVHGKPKISDFGMSRQLEGVSKAGQTKTTVGPVRWMAPESLSDLSYSPQSDVWSFGCVVYEIVALQEPHANTDVITIGIKIRDNGYTPQLPKRVDPFIKKLLRNIWQKDPAKRPTMEQLATTIDEHLAKIEGREEKDDNSSTTPSPIEISALDKSINDDQHNAIGQSSEYDNIKENISTPPKVPKKGKSPKKAIRGKKNAKSEKPISQQKMLQSDDVYEEINQVRMEPIRETDQGGSSSESSSSSSQQTPPAQVPKVPPRSKPSTPQRSLPPVPPRTSQNLNASEGAYDELPK